MLKPLGNQIILKKTEDENVTEGGIHLVGTNTDTHDTGKVVAVGEGRVSANGDLIKPSVKIGDTVLFLKGPGRVITHKGEEFLFITEDSILAIA